MYFLKIKLKQSKLRIHKILMALKFQKSRIHKIIMALKHQMLKVKLEIPLSDQMSN